MAKPAQPALQRAAKAATTAGEAHASSNAPKEKPTAGEQRFEAYYAQQKLVPEFAKLLEALRKPLPITFRIFDATRDALSKSTSPTRRRPDFLVESGMKFVPTSTTTHPGVNQLPLTNWAWPTAATTISASLTILLMFFVLE